MLKKLTVILFSLLIAVTLVFCSYHIIKDHNEQAALDIHLGVVGDILAVLFLVSALILEAEILQSILYFCFNKNRHTEVKTKLNLASLLIALVMLLSWGGLLFILEIILLPVYCILRLIYCTVCLISRKKEPTLE